QAMPQYKPLPSVTRRQTLRCPRRKEEGRGKIHFLAPKLVLTFLVSLPSVSLSSAAAAAAAAAFLLFLVAFARPPPPVALAGVGAPDGPSLPLKLLDMGVGACEAGVEAGVCASCS